MGLNCFAILVCFIKCIYKWWCLLKSSLETALWQMLFLHLSHLLENVLAIGHNCCDVLRSSFGYNGQVPGKLTVLGALLSSPVSPWSCHCPEPFHMVP